MSESITIEAPIRIKSQANLRQHWRYKSLEKQKNLRTLKAFMPASFSFPPLPVKITLIRIAPRFIDDDNLQFAMKEFRDFIADALIPGLQTGRADNDERLIWCYDQKKDQPKKYALRIVIESESEKNLVPAFCKKISQKQNQIFCDILDGLMST